MDETPQQQYHGPVDDNQPYSKLAIWSFVLGILCLCLGPLALIPLILGIIGITSTSGGQGKGMGLAIAGTVLGAFGMLGSCMSAGVLLPALGKARQRANELRSQAQIRSQFHAATIYATQNENQFPLPAQWPDTLIDLGLLEPEILISPLEDGDGVSYIYLGGEQSFDPLQILIYEDPKHLEEGVLLGFADGTVELIPHAEFESMLEDQTAP